jgi:hypothetical protein
MLQRLVRIAAGLILGLAAWYVLTPVYNQLVCRAAAPLFSSMHGTGATLTASGRDALVTRPEAPLRISSVTIPLSDLTINFILLVVLFALNRHPFRDRNAGAFALAAGVVFVVHIPALIAKIETFYVLQPESWSQLEYGGLRGDLWLFASQFYQLIGMHAVAIAAWWLLRPREAGSAAGQRMVRQRDPSGTLRSPLRRPARAASQ